ERLDAVGTAEALVGAPVGAYDVVVGEEVLVPELLGRLGVRADVSRIGADLGVWDDDPNLHGVRSSRPTTRRMAPRPMAPRLLLAPPRAAAGRVGDSERPPSGPG